MNLHHRSTIRGEDAGARNRPTARLQGMWLVTARIAWVIMTGLPLGLLVASLPPYFTYLHIVNTTSIYGPQLAPSDVRILRELGLSLDFYAWLNISVSLLFLLVCVSIGVVLFLRQPDERLALLASLTLVFLPIKFNTQIVGTLPANWTLPTEIVTFFGNICLGFFLFLFPNERFVPRWTTLLMVAWVAYWANINVFPTSLLNNSWFSAVPLVGLVASLIVLQVYRYRHVSTPLQRQQTKWVVFGIAVTFGGSVAAIFLLDGLLPQFFAMSPLSFFFGQTPLTIFLLLFPLSVGFAILRNRLWDIDFLINKTLVYSLLTLLLAAAYAGLIIKLESLVGFSARANTQPLVMVVSTLVIAALFRPLRSRIQRVIDRRFYRRTYDTTHTLEVFNSILRNEVDLAMLSQQLVAVVEETMQPAHISLWLRVPIHASYPMGSRDRRSCWSLGRRERAYGTVIALANEKRSPHPCNGPKRLIQWSTLSAYEMFPDPSGSGRRGRLWINRQGRPLCR